MLNFFNPNKKKEKSKEGKVNSTEETKKEFENLKRSQPSQSDSKTPSAFEKPLKHGKSNSGTLFSAKSIKKKLIYKKEKKSIEEENYKPKTDPLFKDAEFSPFFIIADSFDILSTIKGENSQERKKELISKLMLIFIHHFPQELEELYLFTTSRMDSDYLQSDLGVGNEIMMKSGAESVGMKSKKFREGVKDKGDLGLYVEEMKKGQSTLGSFFTKKVQSKVDEEVEEKRVTFAYVFEKIREISRTNGSLDKQRIFSGLVTQLSGNEAKYVIRFVGKNFKIGCAEKFFQNGIARAFWKYYSDKKKTNTIVSVKSKLILS